MGTTPLFYRFGKGACRFVRWQCIREVVIGRERLDAPGGMLLAVTHIAHLEPVVVGLHTRRHISWVARIEFYRRWWARWSLNAARCIPVNRGGVAVSTIREAVRRIREGGVVGIFPEGGVAHGRDSVFRGGRCKAGACVIAQRAGVAVIPVVVLNIQTLNRAGPFLPFRRGRVFTAYGRPVEPEAGGGPRERRARFARRLQEEFAVTYRELLAASGLKDEDVP